jgi:hypothetical protein
MMTKFFLLAAAMIKKRKIVLRKRNIVFGVFDFSLCRGIFAW